jgi:hypothetical protein
MHINAVHVNVISFCLSCGQFYAPSNSDISQNNFRLNCLFEVFCVLGHDAVLSGRSLPMLQRNLLPPF